MLSERNPAVMHLCVSKRDGVNSELLGLLEANSVGSDSNFRAAVLDRPRELMNSVFSGSLKRVKGQMLRKFRNV